MKPWAILCCVAGAYASTAQMLWAAPLSLADISRYLNGLTAASADFTQINADGSVETGRLYLRKPGRARFEYDGDQALVIAGGGEVAIFDKKSNTAPQQFPLARTPLRLVLAANIDLMAEPGVSDLRMVDGLGMIEAVDPSHPEQGMLQLYFDVSPVSLQQWSLDDGGGGQTRVLMKNWEIGTDLGDTMFSIPFEVMQRESD